MSDFNLIASRLPGAQGAISAVAITGTVPDPPRNFTALDNGTILRGTVQGRDKDGLIAVKTDQGILKIATNANLQPGSNVTLEVRSVGDRLQVVVLAVDQGAATTNTATTELTAGTTAAGGKAQATSPSNISQPANSGASAAAERSARPVSAPSSATPPQSPVIVAGARLTAIVIQSVPPDLLQPAAPETAQEQQGSVARSASSAGRATPVAEFRAPAPPPVQASLLPSIHDRIAALFTEAESHGGGVPEAALADVSTAAAKAMPAIGAQANALALSSDMRERIIALFVGASAEAPEGVGPEGISAPQTPIPSAGRSNDLSSAAPMIIETAPPTTAPVSPPSLLSIAQGRPPTQSLADNVPPAVPQAISQNAGQPAPLALTPLQPAPPQPSLLAQGNPAAQAPQQLASPQPTPPNPAVKPAASAPPPLPPADAAPPASGSSGIASSPPASPPAGQLPAANISPPSSLPGVSVPGSMAIEPATPDPAAAGVATAGPVASNPAAPAPGSSDQIALPPTTAGPTTAGPLPTEPVYTALAADLPDVIGTDPVIVLPGTTGGPATGTGPAAASPIAIIPSSLAALLAAAGQDDPAAIAAALQSATSPATAGPAPQDSSVPTIPTSSSPLIPATTATPANPAPTPNGKASASPQQPANAAATGTGSTGPGSAGATASTVPPLPEVPVDPKAATAILTAFVSSGTKLPLGGMALADAQAEYQSLSTIGGGALASGEVGAKELAGGPLPTGTELRLRVITIQEQPIGGTPVATAQAAAAAGGKATIIGQILGHTPAGHPVIHSPVGDLVLQQQATLPVGANITLAIEAVDMAAAAALSLPVTPQMTALNLAQGWPTLLDLLVTLQHGPGSAAAGDGADPGAAAHLAQPGSKLAAGMNAAMDAFRTGDFEKLFGPLSAAVKASGGKPESVRKLRDEFTQLSMLAQERPQQDWRSFFLPIWDDGRLQQINLFYRRQRRGQSGDKDKNEDATRFVVEVNFTRLGGCQLDGLIRKKNFDLMVRSHQELPLTVKRDLAGLFAQARELGNYAGEISFQTTGRFPVLPLDDIARDAPSVTA